MGDVEYILRIVLKARDELAAVLSKARTQIQGFKRDVDSMDGSMDKLNASLSTLDKNMGGIAQKLEAWRVTMRGMGDDSKEAAKQIDTVGKNADASSRKIGQAAKTTRELKEATSALNQQRKELSKSLRDGNVDADYAAKKFKEIGAQLDALGKRTTTGTDLSLRISRWGDAAKRAADEISIQRKRIETEDIAAYNRDAARAKEAADNRKRLTDDLSKFILNTLSEDEKKLTAVAKAEADERTRVKIAEANAEIDAILAANKEEQRIAKQAADEGARLDKQRARERLAQLEKDQELALRIQDTVAAHQRITQEGARGGDTGTQRRDLERLAKEYDSLSRQFKAAGRDARGFAAEAERAKNAARSLGDESRATTNWLKLLSDGLRNNGDNVAMLDNKLRGIGLLAVVGFAQQLIASLVALGGELVNVASSAVMAGGALGGILAAGAAQALPVIGLLVGAMQRVKSVMDAFQQNQKLQQAQFTDQEKAQNKAIDKTNALANAQETQTAAQDTLRESREALTEAQHAGVRQLEDLVAAEQAAALAAKGASLSVKEAQQALQRAVQGGGSSVEIQRAQLAVEEAKQSSRGANRTLTRATQDRQRVGGKIENLDSVKQAAKAVDDAERGVNRANRGLDQAADKMDRTAASTMTAAANLNFLLSQLSPAERKLYEAVNRVYETYRKVFQGVGTGGSGIYGVIIDSFTRAVDRVNEIIQMPGVIKTIQNLANSIAKEINKAFDSFTSPKQLGQFETIMNSAADNLGPFVDILIDIGHIFLNIAEAANPAFKKLLDYIGDIVGRFLGVTDNKKSMEDFFTSGEGHLEAWLDLLVAIIELFAVLVGASAPEGKKSIEGLTETIEGWTEYLREHREEVADFFHRARKAAERLISLLEPLAKIIFDSFDEKTIENFVNIIENSIIPAIGTLLDNLGKAANFFSKITDNPIGAKAVEMGLLAVAAGQLASSLEGAATYAASMVGAFGRLPKGIGQIVKDIGTKRAAKRGAAAGAAEVGGQMGLFGGAAAGAEGAAGTGVAAAGAGFLLPAAAVAAVVAGVILLLKYFGRLDDVWKGIKDAFQIFLDAIAPALKSLQDALDDLGIHVDDFQDVMKALKFVGQQIADFISVYLIESFKGLAKVIGGVAVFIIRTITGVINILHGAVDIVIGIVKVIIGLFEGLFTGNWDVFEKGFKQISDGFENLIKGIIDIFAGVVEGLIDVFKGLTDIFLAPFKAAWAAVKDFFGVKSPSKLAMDLGRNIIHGLADGLRGAWRLVRNAARYAWDKFKDGISGVGHFGRWIIDKLVDGIRFEVRGIVAVGKWVWGRIKDGFEFVRNFGGTIINRLIDGLKEMPGRLLTFVKTLANDLLEVGKAIGNAIWEGIKKVPGLGTIIKGGTAAVKKVFGGGDDKPAAPPTAPKAPTTGPVPGAELIPFGAKDLKEAAAMWASFWVSLRKATHVSTDDIQRQFRQMRISTSESADRMYRDIRSSVADMQHSFSARGDAIVKSWTETWFNLMKVAFDGLFYIGHETNRALTSLGEKHIGFGLTEPKKGKAEGGFVGNQGERGRDGGLYALGAGEAVLHWGHQMVVNSLLPAGVTLSTIFDTYKGYHAGGPEQRGFAGGRRGQSALLDGHPGNIAAGLIKLLEVIKKRFPGMVVTSTRDHSTYTTSGNVSDHTTGNAMDIASGDYGLMNKVAAWIKSSGVYKSLKQGIHNPNLAVNAGQLQSPPGQFGGAVWAQHANHIHLAMTGALKAVGDMIASIGKQTVTGHAGPLKTILQSVLDMGRKAANKLIDSKSAAQADSSSQTPGGSGSPAPEGQHKRWIVAGLRLAGVPPTAANVAAQYRLDMGESGGNPKIIQQIHDINSVTGNLARGIAQMIPPTFNSYKVRGHNDIFNAVDNIAASARYQMARYGHLVGHPGYAMGGIIPGGDDTPIPILAHAGEWILNKGQQARAAMLAGLSTSGLGSMLGFYGGSHFAGGGDPKKRAPLYQRIVANAEGDLSLDSFVGVAEVVGDLGRIMSRVRRLGNITKRVKPVIDVLDVATREGGMLDQLRGAIERNFARVGLRLRRAQYQVRAGRQVSQSERVTTADAALGEARRQRGYLIDEQDQIGRELKAVHRRQRRKGLTDAQKKLLQAQENNLKQRNIDANERIQQNIEDIFSAQQEAIEAAKEVQQKAIDEIEKRYSQGDIARDYAKRVATALGNTGGLKYLANAEIDQINHHIAELQAQIRTTTDPEIRQTLLNSIQELQTQVTEKTQQLVQDQIEAVNQGFSRRNTQLDLFDRMANAVGTISGAVGLKGLGSLSRAGVLQQRGANLATQRQGLISAFDAAVMNGNTAQMQDLTDQLSENEVATAENTKAQRDASWQAADDTFSYNTSINDLLTQLLDATDAVTGLTSTNDKLALTNEKQALLTNRGIELQTRLDNLAPEDEQGRRDLTRAILENKIATMQNKKALDDLSGVGTAPGTFTSTAWQWFREAFGNGVGGVMPQYTPPSTLGVGFSGMGGNSTTSSVSSQGGNTYITNLEVNEAGGPIDITKIASTVTFAQATAQ
jgi:phage-related protein